MGLVLSMHLRWQDTEGLKNPCKDTGTLLALDPWLACTVPPRSMTLPSSRTLAKEHVTSLGTLGQAPVSALRKRTV